MGEVVVKYDPCENTIHANTQENINALLADGYEVDDDILPATENTPSNTGGNNQPIYKQGCKWNVIDQTRDQDVDKMQRNLMGRRNNSSVS